MSNSQNAGAGAAEGQVVGAVSSVTAGLQSYLRPPLRQVRATLAALTYNDDQVNFLAPLVVVLMTRLTESLVL